MQMEFSQKEESPHEAKWYMAPIRFPYPYTQNVCSKDTILRKTTCK